jgi:hypothetical protein
MDKSKPRERCQASKMRWRLWPTTSSNVLCPLAHRLHPSQTSTGASYPCVYNISPHKDCGEGMFPLRHCYMSIEISTSRAEVRYWICVSSLVHTLTLCFSSSALPISSGKYQMSQESFLKLLGFQRYNQLHIQMSQW